MSKKMVVSAIAVFFSIGLMSAANVLPASVVHSVSAENCAIAEPYFQTIDCKDNTPAGRAAVARAIYLQFEADPNLKDQLGHINASFSQGVVTLRGWAFGPTKKLNDLKGVNRAVSLAGRATDCETKIISKLTSTKKVQCPPGFVSCGRDGLCIPAEEDCHAGQMP